jgi:hypothetical protein
LFLSGIFIYRVDVQTEIVINKPLASHKGKQNGSSKKELPSIVFGAQDWNNTKSLTICLSIEYNQFIF